MWGPELLRIELVARFLKPYAKPPCGPVRRLVRALSLVPDQGLCKYLSQSEHCICPAR